MFHSHIDSHPLMGQIVTVIFKGDHPQLESGAHEFEIEDWNDRVFGGSWAFMSGNPAAMIYAMRAGINHLPIDNEVVYGKVGAFGHLVHISEIVTVPHEVL